MTDVYTKAKRSEVMSRIRSSGNKDTEQALANLFRQNNIMGWRRNQKIYGKPDFVFKKHKLAVFVDGCFWHGCPRCYRPPKTNQKFWRNKIARNRDRDISVNQELRKQGWRIIRIWEHDLASRADKITHKIQSVLKIT